MRKYSLPKLVFILAIAAALTAGAVVSLAAQPGTQIPGCPATRNGCTFKELRQIEPGFICCIYACRNGELPGPCFFT